MILVTGGAGLLGSELIDQLLLQGKSVLAIYRHTPISQNQFPQLIKVPCDILDVVGLESIMSDYKVSEVFHCAALVSFNPAFRDQLYKINVEGTANVVNACLATGVKKLVHVSSVAALGKMEGGKPMNETIQWTEETGNSAYGQSKYMGEMEVWRGLSEGLQAVVINPVVILGSGNWEAGSSKMFKSIYHEFPWYSEGTTGFVDVQDVARAMISLMESGVNGERYIVCAENRSFREVFDWIAKGFGKKPPHKKVTPMLAALVWRWEAFKSFFSKQEPLVTRETAHTALLNVQFDNQKLLKQLPAFQYQTVEQSIQRICKEFIPKYPARHHHLKTNV